MVIRRIREHATTQNWFAVGIDLAIVIIGVFLGIQASNWNDSRIEAAEGLSYRARLLDELDFNIRQHQQQSAYYRQVLNHGRDALRTLESGSIDDPTEFLIDAVQLTQVDTSPGKSYIYSEMVSAGLVGLLGDDRVQQAASDYYVQVAANDRTLSQVYPYRDSVRGIIPYSVQGAVQAACGDRPVHYQGRIIGVRLADTCRVRLDSALAASAAQQIFEEPGIERQIVRYIGSIHERLGSFDKTLLLAESLRASLRKGD